MAYMFGFAKAFNQDISNWNINDDKNTAFMFNGAEAFNQDISNWKLKNDSDNMFINCPIESKYKPKFND